MPMVVTDPRQPDNPIVLANQAFLDLTGYSAEEVIGRNCRFLQGPETAACDSNKIHEGLVRDDDHLEVELLNYRKDGSTFWNHLIISPVHNEAGVLLYHFGSQRDVTVKRRIEALEATERRLLMEVDHRTMNALALVQSIVVLSRAETAEGLLSSINGRIASLARAYRQLAVASWNQVDLLHLIQDQLSQQPNLRINIDGPKVFIGSHVVQPLSLVLHELISNAITHNAFSDETCHIQLSWASNDSMLRLRWTEHGAALNGAIIEEKFGLRIARNLIENQLAGQMALDLLCGKLTVTIAVPTVVVNVDS
jgi:PAS domain S-box-containing protein